jgi:hypothetical protein
MIEAETILKREFVHERESIAGLGFPFSGSVGWWEEGTCVGVRRWRIRGGFLINSRRKVFSLEVVSADA